MNRTQGFGSPSTIGILRGGIRSLYNFIGAHTHNSIGGSQILSKLHNLKSSRHSNRLGYTMHPRGTSSWEHNAPKSNKLLNLQLHVSPWGEQPDATNAKGKTTQSGQVLHSEIQPKQLMLWRDLRGRTKSRITKNSKIKIY